MIQNQTDPAAELADCLKAVEAAGAALRDAMLLRRADAIWAAIERQEQVTSQLEAARRRLDSQGDLAPEQRNAIRGLATRARIVQAVNARLCCLFTGLIDRTFQAINSRLETNPLIYGARGVMERTSAPIFVQQTG